MPLRKIKSGLRRYPGVLARSFGRKVGIVPQPATPVEAHAYWRDHAIWQQADLAASWIGHASVLIRVGEVTILTDPVWSERIGLRVGNRVIGPERLLEVPGDVEHLPPVDVILLSHAHFDHFDRPTLERLAHPRTTVITATRTGSLVPAGFGRVMELASGHSRIVRGASIRAFEPQHWGARFGVDRYRGVNSYLIEHADKRIVVGGDTADTFAYRHVGRVDLAVMGIGAYEPWIDAHATPEQVWRMTEEMRARWLLPVHHSTFHLSDEPMEEPMERLLEAGDPDRIVQKAVGGMFTAA
jgi:L-ascorbate metabolism protein UlaG (beta-lactamase superfamily)